MTHKEHFLKGPHAKAFADIAGSEVFREACNYAMLEMVDKICVSREENLSTESVIKGARGFLAILNLIAIPEEPDKPADKPSLNYNAYNSPDRL